MSKPTVFEFTSYKFEPENKRILFKYAQKFKGREPIIYTETIILPETPDLKGIPKGLVDKLLQSLHLILGISYFKFYPASAGPRLGGGCSPIKIEHPYSLSKEEAEFWNTVYKKGLGEFFYRNKLDPNIAPKFPYRGQIASSAWRLPRNDDRYLVAVSGGKDSIVAVELLKERGIGITAIFTETQKKSEFVERLAEKMGMEFVKIQRFLDAQVFQKHVFDGHIPISAVYAFLGILYAVLYKYSGFIVANEYSSNFGNIKYKGEIVNHQWSKSSEFEILFQNYLKNFISPDLNYFSLLRPFYEIRVAKLFANYKKYFSYFSSCNKNFKIIGDENKNKLWCGECPKCAFVFLLMSAFLDKEELVNIFGKNLFEQKNLLPLFADILGFGKLKPFDCVGTFDESMVALFLSRDKFSGSLAIKTFLPRIKNGEKLVEKVFKAQDSNAPDYLKFSGLESVGILGYGREGKVTEEYLKKNYSNLKIGILDKSLDKNYLKKQKNFDILIKTPGIIKDKVKNNYTTATNIFFSETKATGNKIIGVTGSKGKSTTASLIYEILKKSGNPPAGGVKLLGNIGVPMLSTLLAGDEIFVLELSSAQLDDIKYSPDIAVVTNLFPEHMDYHGNEENYFEAKKNILNFQGAGDYLIYSGRNKLAKNWSAMSRGEAIDFSKIKLPKKIKPKILGGHNLQNIRAAVAVAKIFRVSEKDIVSAVNNFKGLPHRLEFVGEFKGIKFYDDAVSTTPESTIEAIKTLKNIDTIFLGGLDRGYDFSQLAKELKEYKIKNVVLFSDIPLRGFDILKTRSMEEAVKFAYKNTKPGKICLLSCASPSYSLWKNFEEKGDEFKKFIEKYSE